MKISNNTKGLLYAVAAGFLWSVLAIIIKVTLNYVPAKTIAWARFVVAFIILISIQVVKNPRSFKIFTKPPLLVIFSAIAIGLNYLLYMEGINYTSPNNAAIFIQSGPLLLAVFGFVIYKEKLNIYQMLGFFIAIIGFIFFYSDQFRNLFQNDGLYNKGVLYIILAGACWSVYSIIQKELVKKHKADDLNMLNFGLPAVMLFISAEPQTLFHIPWYILLIVIFLGANTWLAYTFLSQALRYTEANKISIILTTNPTLTFLGMAILTGLKVTWINGESFTALSLFGAFLVIAGAVVVSLFKK